ncbi:MAG: hypothetical protein HFE48_03355 [Clostridia bacterium]|nr:hypothetical protein [Clostridia bacterium]
MKKRNDLIKTKLDMEYVLLERLLELISHLGITKRDKKLTYLFDKLIKYVDSLLRLPETAGDINDIYVVVEQTENRYTGTPRLRPK